MKSRLFVILMVMSFALWAQASDLMLATIPGLSVPVIIPINDHETGAQALQRYEDGISHTTLAALWQKASRSSPTLQIKTEHFVFSNRKEYVLIVANKPSDMSFDSKRSENVARLWREQGFEPVLLALGASASLSKEQAEEFNDKIAENFKAMMALGGDDVDPKLYGEDKTFARYTHPLRDVLEYNLIKKFKTKAKGLFIGLCRGHQLGAVVDGHTLYQDLVQDKVSIDSHHEDSKHSLRLEPELQRLTGIRRSSVTVNSIHHQAVRVNPLAASRPVAYSDDGVVEALEMKNGHGLSFQFHPEIMADIENTSLLDRYLGKKFFTAITKKMREVSAPRPSCRRAHL